MAIYRKNSDIPRVVADFKYIKTTLPQLNMNLYIVGYNSKKLPDAAKNYFIAALDLFGLVIKIYAFR